MEDLKKRKLRQNKILDIIRQRQTISSADLLEQVDFSYPTLCRDLNELERENKIVRFHGGVRYADENINALTPHPFACSDYYLYQTRQKLNLPEKQAIGRTAASLVQNNDIVFISHGTTTVELVKALEPQIVLTVITDGLDIINTFRDHPNVRLYTTGGTMNYRSMQIEHNPYISCDISNININKLFIGVGGFSFSKGLTFYDFNSFDFIKQIIPNCDELIVLADTSKFEYTALANFISIDQITTLVTDWMVDPAHIRKMEELHLNYLIAPKLAAE